MSNAPNCPKCGIALPTKSPGGMCPACLLKAGIDSQPPGQGSHADVSQAQASQPQKSQARDSFPPTYITPPAASGFVPPTPEELARLLPQLEIRELLGKGGMGAVYQARHPGLDRLVAVKILPAEISHDPSFAERFQREARALARLSHPNIVAVFDFGQTAGLFYFVMEFVDGANLRQMIQTGTLTPPEALAIVPQICEALQFAHDEGIVHRDIKPENILLDKKGRVKIADFGLAKLLGESDGDQILTGTHQVMGTLRYMAPEQMQGSREVDHRADIYSLGVVFYELLTGQLPMGRFAPPSRKVHIDVRLDEVVLRALEQDPEQRYQQASDVRHELESIRTSRLPPVNNSSGNVPEPLIEPRFSRFAIIGAVWSLFGILSIVPIWFFLGLSRVWNGTALPTDLIHTSPPVVFTIFMGVLLALGAGAPIGTTVYGAVAISHIRRSRGKIVGLPLAVADVCLFPLLLLDYLILMFVAVVVMVIMFMAFPKGPPGNFAFGLPTMLTLAITVPLAVWIDFLIVRGIWRALTRPSPAVNAPAGTEKRSASHSAAEVREDLGPSPSWEADLPAARTHSQARLATLTRPRLVPVFATLNLLAAVVLMLVCAGTDPLPLPASTPGIWHIWSRVSNVLGFLMAAGLFTSSIGLFLWQAWARKLLLAVCIYGLASFVIDMPYLAQAEIPNIVADMRAFMATDGFTSADQDLYAPLIFAGLFGGMLLVVLPWLIGQLIYFKRPAVVSAFNNLPSPKS